MPRFRLGLIINPFAGIGGATGLKGSDGAQTRELALSKGAIPLANQRAQTALSALHSMLDNVVVLTAAGEMGERTARAMGFDTEVIYTPASQQTEAEDTKTLARMMLDQSIDALVFAGGDGTATDIYQVIGNQLPVLGIPAGCKIHSGVYAVSPSAAGVVLQQMVSGELVSVRDAEVRDIDENAFRQGQVIAKHVGEMQVPEELQYIQAVKMGGKESDELLIADFGDYLNELFDEYDDHMFVIGSGSTIDGAMQSIGLENTLLGVDLVFGGDVIAQDMTAQGLLDAVGERPVKIVVTLIGGQGHIFGRGNQQISPALIQKAGKANIIVIASKKKLQGLDKRPLQVDTGDTELDQVLGGMINIVTGYRDHVLYPVAGGVTTSKQEKRIEFDVNNPD
ncbi:ATP-NAD kinase family protein [Alteromonas facilis]|uniref:ATP-NAD kinase family protein n=1 Tax=Alteromonas facilis TaxID=2048004 RepID=UPI000C288BB9|nr:ATP-NAD kinase family protein [Alteromonas facilis]